MYKLNTRMPLRVAFFSGRADKLIFSLHGQIGSQEEEVKGVVWGIKGEFSFCFLFFLSSFPVTFPVSHLLFQSFPFIRVWGFCFPLFLSGTRRFRLSRHVQTFARYLRVFSFPFPPLPPLYRKIYYL